MKFYETCSDGFIVAELNRIVVGFVVGFLAQEGTGRIFSLAVHPLYQNRGIGSALLREIIAVFQKSGVVEVVLEVRLGNLKARRFYERHGFEETGIAERYYSDGESAFLMKLNVISQIRSRSSAAP